MPYSPAAAIQTAEGQSAPAVESRTAAPGNMTVALIPNPAHDAVWVDFELEAAAETVLSLYDANGRLVVRERFQAAAGPNRYRLDLAGYAAGVYTVQLTTAGENVVKLLVVAKQ